MAGLVPAIHVFGRPMTQDVYLRNGAVYIPTLGKMDEGFYRGVEPVAVVPVAKTEEVREALQTAIARGNPIVPMLRRSEWKPPVILKYAGVRYWSAFERGMQFWDITRKDGAFRIAGQKKQPNRMWKDDPDQIVIFPADATVDEVVERMIGILQDAAQR